MAVILTLLQYTKHVESFYKAVKVLLTFWMVLRLVLDANDTFFIALSHFDAIINLKSLYKFVCENQDGFCWVKHRFRCGTLLLYGEPSLF